MMPPYNIRLKVQSYLLTYPNKRKFKLIERALRKRGSNISDFLSNSGYDQNIMTRLIATKSIAAQDAQSYWRRKALRNLNKQSETF